MDATRLPSLGPRGEGWVVLQFVLVGAVAVVGLVAGGSWAGPLALMSAVCGLALIIVGGVLAARGLLDLGTGLTPLPRPRHGARLVAHGAYRLARHPIYGGLILVAFGWALLMASLLGLVLAAVLFGFFDLKSRREEAWLVEVVRGYEDYRTQTRRFIPGLY